MELNYILLNLEIVKQVKENDKLGVIILPGEKKLFVDSSSILSPLIRWYSGYNRKDTIVYLEELTEKIEKFSHLIKDGNHIDSGCLLKKAIKEAIKGLENLKLTYISDSITIAKLVLIINKLIDVISRLENMEKHSNFIDYFNRTNDSGDE